MKLPATACLPPRLQAKIKVTKLLAKIAGLLYLYLVGLLLLLPFGDRLRASGRSLWRRSPMAQAERNPSRRGRSGDRLRAPGLRLGDGPVLRAGDLSGPVKHGLHRSPPVQASGFSTPRARVLHPHVAQAKGHRTRLSWLASRRNGQPPPPRRWPGGLDPRRGRR